MSGTAFLISIRPQFAELIFSGHKTVELRRVPPKVESGDLALVYVSSPTMEVQGCFEVDRIESAPPEDLWKRCGAKSGISRECFFDYFSGKKTAHAIFIRRAWKLKAGVRLARLRREKGGFRPPQNFRYIGRSVVALLSGAEAA